MKHFHIFKRALTADTCALMDETTSRDERTRCARPGIFWRMHGEGVGSVRFRVCNHHKQQLEADETSELGAVI